MKRTILFFCVLTMLLLALTGCMGRNKTNVNIDPDRYDYGDSDYTADENGMTNEYGQDGTNDSTVNRYDNDKYNGTYNNGNTNNGMNNNGTTNNSTYGSGTTRPNSFANGVQDAVDDAGDVVDDIADGAANAVDNATDAVEDAAGAVTKGRTTTNRSNYAA